MGDETSTHGITCFLRSGTAAATQWLPIKQAASRTWRAVRLHNSGAIRSTASPHPPPPRPPPPPPPSVVLQSRARFSLNSGAALSEEDENARLHCAVHSAAPLQFVGLPPFTARVEKLSRGSNRTRT